LVRNPESLSGRPNLLVVQGTPAAKEDVEKAILSLSNDTPQAVIVTLSAPRRTDSPFAKPIVGPRFMADAMANVTAAMESHNIKRIANLSAFGVGDSFQHLNFLVKPIIKHSNMSYQFNDHGFVDEEIRGSLLEWILVRPVMLTDQAARPIKFLGNKGEHATFMPSISRASVAKFLVDAVETEDWVKRTPVISN
jgi:hypothetical protein